MRLKVKAKDLIIVVLLAIAMLYRINSIRVQWYFRYIFISPIILYGILYYYNKRKSLTGKVSRVIFTYSMAPHFLAFLYTIVLLVLSIAESQYFSRAISNTIQMMLIGLFVLSMTMLYGNKSVMILFKSMIVSYLITIIMAIRGVGISGIISYLKSPISSPLAIWFEMHDLCLSISLILLYFFFGKSNNQKQTINIIVAIIILFLGFKRIGIFALIVAVIFGLWIRKKANAIQHTKLWIIAVFILVFGIIYTYICTTDLYAQIALAYGIDTASRVRIYANFRRYYELSFTYLGQGVGFVTKQLTLLQENGGFGVGGITALHNDLLLQYIELGFWGSILWFAYYIFQIPKKLKEQYGYNIERIYYILLVCAFVIYCSDNTMHYFIFQSSFFLILSSEILTQVKYTNQQDVFLKGKQSD